MDFVPHTPDEFNQMLQAVGLSNADELFRTIPQALKNPDISFPPALTELGISKTMAQAAYGNHGSSMISFLGGGAYDHFIPAAVPALISRGDFETAYTPYQPEVSQGTLQSIYEFQTLICRLTGMEAANASMYDGASALAEAALMACRIKRKEKVAIADTINPHYKRVLKTYLSAPGIELVEIPNKDGVTDLESLKNHLDDSFAAFFVQNPNYFGIVEPVDEIDSIVHAGKNLLGAVVYPHSLGLLKSPGKWNADIVIGDLQSFGLPLQYGGPYAGFIATLAKNMRQMPGRMVGRTKDEQGQVGYVLTLQTREQHIRRAKATSNICSNQALCALAATVYLALIGPNGLRRAAELSVQRAHELQTRLCAIDGVSLAYDQPFFNEFVLEIPGSVGEWIKTAKQENLLPGILLETIPDKTKEGLLVCATEKNDPSDIDRYVELFSKYVS